MIGGESRLGGNILTINPLKANFRSHISWQCHAGVSAAVLEYACHAVPDLLITSTSVDRDFDIEDFTNGDRMPLSSHKPFTADCSDYNPTLTRFAERQGPWVVRIGKAFLITWCMA